jgi:pimeloyl-ACP methyl ester carboxylesterase
LSEIFCPRHFVLLHGAFHGAWCWSPVVEILRAAGHEVSTPTQTGVGERRHLMSPEITLDVFTDDLLNHIEAEELTGIVLVGHSFGGFAISAAADRMPERIRHLVYLDSRIPEAGKSAFDVQPDDIAAERRRQSQEFSNGLCVPPPSPEAFGVPKDHPLYDWVQRRLTPHPMGSMTSPFHMKHPVGNGVPTTYIACTDPLYPSLESSRQIAKARDDWNWKEIATGHDAMVTAPHATAELLMEIAG